MNDQIKYLKKWVLAFFERESADKDNNFILMRGDQAYSEIVSEALREIYPSDRDPLIDHEMLHDDWFVSGDISDEDRSMLVLSDGALVSVKLALLGLQITSNGEDEEFYVIASECYVSQPPECALLAEPYAVYFDTLGGGRILAMTGAETEFRKYRTFEAAIEQMQKNMDAAR